jgi:hypothetical protein
MGFIIGLLPYLVMFLGVDGFFSAFVGDIRRIVLRGANIPLPVPWPWTVTWTSLNSIDLSAFILGLLFLAVPIFYAAWGFSQFSRFQKTKFINNRLLLVCVLVGLPYLHYAFTRADDQHLSIALSPFWLGFIAQKFRSQNWRRALVILAMVLSTACIGVRSGLTRLIFPVPGLVECRLDQDTIELDPNTAGLVQKVKEISQNLRPGESFLFYPHLPALYCVLGLKDPIWGLYSVFPDPEVEQDRSIRDVEKNNVRWAFIDNWLVDGRESWKFEMGQPLFWNYLNSHFQMVSTPLPRGCFLFHKPEGSVKNPELNATTTGPIR